ncbi:MAG: hypothetical protein ACT4P7_01215 [Gemmatimonadaceae bacterium]
MGAVLLAFPDAARAQQQFTQQIILVPTFQGRDRRLADAIGDALPSRVQQAYRRMDVSVVSERGIAEGADGVSRQYLDDMDQLEPIVAQQVATLCTGP